MVPLMCFSTSSGDRSEALFSVYFPFWNWRFYQNLNAVYEFISAEFVWDIHYVISNPHQASYKTLKSLNIDPKITVLEYYLNLKEHEHSEVCMWVVNQLINAQTNTFYSEVALKMWTMSSCTTIRKSIGTNSSNGSIM